jgi:membrane-associated phospholipid phosphatase
VLMAALVAVVFAATVWSGPGQRVDAVTLGLAADIPAGVREAAARVRDATPFVLVAAMGLCAVVWLARRRPAAAVFCLALPPVVWFAAARLRDDLLDRPARGVDGYLENTFPSGHAATTLIAVAIALATVRPRSSWRAVVLVIPALAALVSVWTQAHRGSDVIGGILLAGIAVPLVPAVLRTPGRTHRDPARFGAVTLVVAAGVSVTATLTGGAPAGVLALAAAAAAALALLPVLGPAPARLPSTPFSPLNGTSPPTTARESVWWRGVCSARRRAGH